MTATTVPELNTQMESYLTQLTAAADACIPDEWTLGASDTNTVDGAVKWAEESIRKGESTQLFGVFAGSGEDARVVALTGNGTHSEAHMRYIAMLQPRGLKSILGYTKMLYELTLLFGAVEQAARNLADDPSNQQEWTLLKMGLSAVDQYLAGLGD